MIDFFTNNYNIFLLGSSKSNSSSSLNGSGDQIWYMFDDDKIKAMTQREFEDLLSPSRKITITPYLLFYARFDLQQISVATKGTTNNVSGGDSGKGSVHSVSKAGLFTAGGNVVNNGSSSASSGTTQIPLGVGTTWLKEEVTNSNLMGIRM